MQHAYGLDVPLTLEDACDPGRMALIVYDMQVGVVGQIANGHAVTERVLAVLESAREAGVRVVFTRHMSLPNEVAGASALRTAMAWQRVSTVSEVHPALARGSAGFEIVPELRPRDSEAVFDKISMSAFVGTPLDIVLRDCGVSAFAIAGVALEVGIEPTVRHATDLGYLPVVIEDACGAGNAAAAERSLAALRFAGGTLFTDSTTFATEVHTR
ncbi:MAG: cysteine hydrolase [Actinobacteria bacterium]|nr:MAG: cysteine hydrolase [Actinomycetota bacterium]